MTARTICPICGAPLPADVSSGFCPGCSLLGAISLSGDPETKESTDATDALSDRDLGDYELLEEIGRGGMGVVFRAHQISLNRIVAVKMLLHGRFADRAFRRRFRLEAEAAAHLEHPNIVPIHEIGEHAGQPFFSMSWVDGLSLDRELAEGPLPPERCAHIVAALAHAVHHAHQHGILHRDLKPHNVIIDVNGEPHLTDFGLAKLLEYDTGLTMTEAILGSPGFVAPEQAAGANSTVTTAADIFSLGAILYAMLTGVPPFSGESPIATLHKVMEADPTLLRTINPSLPRDLETICLKCLQKEPVRRYESAGALALDLERWKKHEPIRARPVNQLERIGMWCRRRPWRAGLATALIVAILAGGIGVVSQWQRAERASRKAQAAALQAESDAYSAQILLAQALITQGHDQEARQTLLKTGPEHLRSWEWGWLMRECNQERMTLGTNSDRQTALAFSPDGQFILTGCADGAVRIWETQSGTLSKDLKRESSAPVVSFSLSHDGKSAITTHSESPARVWNLVEETLAHALGQPGTWITSAAFSPDGTMIATGDAQGNIQFWDPESGQLLQQVTQTVGGAVRALAFSPDGRQLAYSGGTYDPTNQVSTALYILDLDTQSIRKLTGHKSSVEALKFSPNGEWLASAGRDGTVRIAPARGAVPLRIIHSVAHEYELNALAFNPDSSQLAVAGGRRESGIIHLVDLGSEELTVRLAGHNSVFVSVEYAADGRTFAAVCDDGKVHVMPVNRYPAYLNLEGHDGDVWALDVSPDGRYIASGSLDQTAKIWEMETGQLINTIHAHFPVVTLAFTADGQHLVTTAEQNSAKVWPVLGGDADLELSGHGALVRSVAVDPKGRWIATGSRDQRARLWDSYTGELLRTYSEHVQSVTGLAFSPDGERLATASRERHAIVWETQTGRKLCQMTGPNRVVTRIAFSPDGRRLATASFDGYARIWDADTGEAVGSPIKSRFEGVRWIAFSPDGKRLLTTEAANLAAGAVDAGRTVELWDIAYHRRLWAFLPHSAPTFAMCFSPDGRRIITGGGDNTVRIWSAFPWMPDDYPETESSSLESRLESFKRDYWSRAIEPTSSFSRQIELQPWGGKNTSRPIKIISSPSRPITPRPSDAGENQIDLSPVYNAALNEVWQPIRDYFHLDLDLAPLSPGQHIFEGVQFDIRGVVQLRSKNPGWDLFPSSVDIPINRRIQRFHVVHSAVYLRPEEGDGTTIGTYRLHYDDGGDAITGIVYGVHLRTFLGDFDKRTDCEQSNLVWQWREPTARINSKFHRLFKAAYENPRPDDKVTHIEFLSGDTQTAPFLVGMTVE